MIMIDLIINVVLLLFLMVMAITILRSRGMLTMAMTFGLYSLLMAGLFVVMDAPDVAFTEAAVGSGVSTVLMLATLALTKTRYEKHTTKLQWRPLLVVLITGAALLYGIHDIAQFGDPEAVVHHHVADRYIADAQTETGVPNLVTAVLASYRGFDTLGEVVVIFTAGVGVMLLLGRSRRVRNSRPEDES
jgi:multicomponent Na+:H+ antiporter subunit B